MHALLRSTLKSIIDPIRVALSKPRTSVELCAMVHHDPIRTMVIVGDLMRLGKVREENDRYQWVG